MPYRGEHTPGEPHAILGGACLTGGSSLGEHAQCCEHAVDAMHVCVTHHLVALWCIPHEWRSQAPPSTRTLCRLCSPPRLVGGVCPESSLHDLGERQ